ncbi:MAG: RDD family protein [Ilumatobacteraceae bacterium]
MPFPAVTPTEPPSPVAPPSSSPGASVPATSARDDDLQDLLDRLHEDMDLGEQTPAAHVGSTATTSNGTTTTGTTTSTGSAADGTRPALASAVAIEMGDGIAFQPDFASFGARFGGLLLDIALLTVACVPGIAVLALGSGALAVALGALLLFAGFAAATVLYATGVSRTGQSFGNRVTGSRVVDARNGHLISAGDAGSRYVVRMLVSMILFIGFLTALGNSQRRTFHDNIAGTVVIRPTRATWTIDDEREH